MGVLTLYTGMHTNRCIYIHIWGHIHMQRHTHMQGHTHLQVHTHVYRIHTYKDRYTHTLTP